MPKKSSKDLEEELKIWESTPLYLTEEGLKKIKEELEHLRRIRPEIIAEVKRTAEYGDRSENDEYKQAKGRLRRTQARMLTIQNQLKKIKIIPAGPSPDGKIRMGSQVTAEWKGKEVKLHIVGPDETNPNIGRISYISPVGSAFMDHREGDVVRFETGAGTQEYKILKVE